METTNSTTQRIRDLLVRRKRTSAWLARECGISAPHMHYVLRGERLLTPRVAVRIALALDVAPEELAPQEVAA